MTLSISQRVAAVQTPVIPEVADLIDANPGTISLGQGVVYYPPPKEVFNGVSEYLESGNHLYQAVEGIPSLRVAFETKAEIENGIDSSQYSVVVSAGSNMGFLNALLATCDPGDEVILLQPWFFNHEMAVRLVNCVPVSVDTNQFYQPELSAIETAITSRTKVVVTVSPNNPTGAVYSRDVLRQINQLCADRGIYHVSDEAYEYFCYDDSEHYSPAVAVNASGHTISLFSTSKSFGIPSWRVGFMLVPKHLFESVRKIQDTNVICPPVISQYAALQCLKVGRKFCKSKLTEIAKVREHLSCELKKINRISVGPMQGAFYALIEVPDVAMSDMEIVKCLIETHGVAVIPGQAFGLKNRSCLRISYGATEAQTAVKGIERLTNGLRSLLSI